MNFSVFQIVILAVFGALAVAGVLIFAFVVGRAQTDSLGSVEIWGTFDDEVVAGALRQLGDSDARAKSVVYVEKKDDTYAAELTEALASGTGPDLFFMTQDEVIEDGSKVVAISYESIPKEQFENTFVEAATPFLRKEGVVAVPMLIDPLVMYWNKDMLETAGYAKPPEAWSELYDMSGKITKRDESRTLQRMTIALGEYQNITHAKEILSLLMLQAGGRITNDVNGKILPALSSGANESQRPTESALRFFTEFANPINAYYTWNRAQRDSRAAFGAGTLALYIGTAREEPLIRRTNPNLNFAVAPVPQIKAKEYATNVGTVYALAIPKTSDNQNGALVIASLLASPEPTRIFSEAIGIPSARRDVLSELTTCFTCLQFGTSCPSDDVRNNCKAKYGAAPILAMDNLFNKQAIIAKSWIDPNPQKTDEAFQAMIESITSGAAKLSDAIQKAEEALSTLSQKK